MYNPYADMNRIKAEIARNTEEKNKRIAEETRRAWERAQIIHERNINALKRLEENAPRTITINPGPNPAAPPPPIVFR